MRWPYLTNFISNLWLSSLNSYSEEQNFFFIRIFWPFLEGFDMSCLPELGVSRQYDDLLTTRPFDSSSANHLLNFSLISVTIFWPCFLAYYVSDLVPLASAMWTSPNAPDPIFSSNLRRSRGNSHSEPYGRSLLCSNSVLLSSSWNNKVWVNAEWYNI